MSSDKRVMAEMGPRYRYPAAGHPKPPGGTEVHLLTLDNVCVTGYWTDDGRYKAWAPKPDRDKAIEQRLGLLPKKPQPEIQPEGDPLQ